MGPLSDPICKLDGELRLPDAAEPNKRNTGPFILIPFPQPGRDLGLVDKVPILRERHNPPELLGSGASGDFPVCR